MTTDQIRLPAEGVFLGRAMAEGWTHPAIVTVRDGEVIDITSKTAPTSRDICEMADPAGFVAGAKGKPVGSLADIAANSFDAGRDSKKPYLLSPVDLQAVKAAGVTFVVSLLERVIEEQARGSSEKADAIRADIAALIGHDLSKLKPGSAEAMAVKAKLIERGRVVAISRSRHRTGRRDLHQVPADGVGRLRRRCRPASGLDVEQSRAGDRGDRRRAPAASSARRSATTSTCATSKAARRCCSARPRTTTRPPRSGRSSGCSTATFTLDDVKSAVVALKVEGEDGFVLEGASSMAEISRSPGRTRRGGDRPASPVPGRLRALSRNHVRAGEGSRRGRQGLHAHRRRHRHHLVAKTWRAGQSGPAVAGLRALDLRRQPPDARPRQGRADLAGVAISRQGDYCCDPGSWHFPAKKCRAPRALPL